MSIHQLERVQVVSLGIDECWRFFSDPRNLEKITPPALALKLQSELPAEIYPGLMIAYTVKPLLGIRLRWLTEILHVDPPHRFVDEQRAGPYRVWHHEHFFRALPNDETEVRDLVTYVLPFGSLGALVNRLLVRPQLERIFDFRRERIPSRREKGAA